MLLLCDNLVWYGISCAILVCRDWVKVFVRETHRFVLQYYGIFHPLKMQVQETSSNRWLLHQPLPAATIYEFPHSRVLWDIRQFYSLNPIPATLIGIVYCTMGELFRSWGWQSQGYNCSRPTQILSRLVRFFFVVTTTNLAFCQPPHPPPPSSPRQLVRLNCWAALRRDVAVLVNIRGYMALITHFTVTLLF